MIQDDCARSITEPLIFDNLKNQVILVAGGTGFIGKWVAEMIVFANQTMQVNIKLYLLGRDIERFRKEVPHLAKDPFIHLIEHDIRNLHDLPSDIQWVINAVGTPDNREHASQPLKTLDILYKGTTVLLEACFRLPRLNKIIHLSSHQVYGHRQSNERIVEKEMGSLAPNSINSAYAEGKRISETICAIFRNQYKLPITIVRPFAFIGPYQSLHKPWAVNNFIRDGILGGPIRILGNENTVRSYLYASDMAYYLICLLAKGVVGETYNLGSEESIALNDLAKRIVKHIGSTPVEIVLKSSKESYPEATCYVPDMTKSKKDVLFKTRFTIDDALVRTISWNQIINIVE